MPLVNGKLHKLVRALLIGAVLVGCAVYSVVAQPATVVRVYIEPDCTICENWQEDMRDAGFFLKVKEMRDISSVKRQLGVTEELEGCLTAIVQNYVIEGHVPVRVINRLLREKPLVRGLALPLNTIDGIDNDYERQSRRNIVYSFRTDGSEPVPYFSGPVNVEWRK
ncbi:DUF411 domain-containing protein [Rhodobacteraceae bacterium RKSG542]|uniref:DUF411 domain-containing protein n=1 Tax=Pseudovibrio flavus TaxID=2529854 RepID=UPI0012BC8B61|nr:DUF411 domain-containing protein [Pseudovibrio flavus]MTI16219.1 DUF411 domain-containing protein [Pseudovibrio flavus]